MKIKYKKKYTTHDKNKTEMTKSNRKRKYQKKNLKK